MTSQPSTVTAPGQVNFRGHIAEFDGLRALGLSLVLLDHISLKNYPAYLFQLGNLGWIAMDSFFVMSGFLITGILLDSREKPNFFSTYYARRSLRIFPLYYAVLLAWWLILRHTNGGQDYRYFLHNWGSPAWFAFYLGNIRQAFVTTPPAAFGSVATWAYAPLWSLQIEEQFYLLFPLAIAWMRRDHLRRLLIAAVVCSPLFRCALYLWQPDNAYLEYTLLPTHCEGIALGALIAIRFRSGPWKVSKKLLSALTAVLLGATCVGSIWSTWGTYNQGWGSQWDRLAGYSLSSLACACLILWLIHFRGSGYTAWMRLPPLRYLGKISYGVYLLHPLAIWTVLQLDKHWLHFHKNDVRYVFYGISLSLIYASASWYLFEQPFLRLKERITNVRGRILRPIQMQRTGTGG